MPDSTPVRRIGVMGGTFDPIHHGHLVAASEVADRFSLDETVFVPTGQPWQKSHRIPAPAEHRYLMTVIATAADPRFRVSRVDIDRSGPTYTIDTLRDLRAQRGSAAEFYFITGADALAQILTWRDPEQVLASAHLVGVTRPGHDLHAPGLPAGAATLVEVPALAISSTDIRRSGGRRAARGLPRPTRGCHLPRHPRPVPRDLRANSDPRSIIGVRKHIVVTSVIGLVALISLGVVLVVFQPQEQQQVRPAPDPQPVAQEQPVLLMQITEGIGSVNSVLLGGSVDGAAPAMTAIPSRAAMAVGDEMRTMVSLNVALNPTLPSTSVGNTLGVRVDGGWRLDRKALAGVVDSIGGLSVTTEEPLRLRGPDNEVQLRLPTGTTTLDGTQAGWYATGFLDGQEEAAAQQRFMDVVEQILVNLPDNRAELAQLLISLGSLSTVTTDSGTLADALGEFGEQLREQPAQRYSLPLTQPVPIGVLQPDPELDAGQIGAQTRYLPGLVDQRSATPGCGSCMRVRPELSTP